MAVDVLVVGGGISGLTTAFTVAEASSLQVAIAEAGEEWGVRLFPRAMKQALCGN